MVRAQHDAANILVISDFNAQNLASLLSNCRIAGTPLRATSAPFGQVMQLLLSPHTEAWAPELNAAVVWTSPQSVSNAYANMLACQPLSVEGMVDEVKAYARALSSIPPHLEFIFVPTWVPLHPFEGRRGLLDMNLEMGPAAALMRMNLALADAVQQDKGSICSTRRDGSLRRENVRTTRECGICPRRPLRSMFSRKQPAISWRPSGE